MGNLERNQSDLDYIRNQMRIASFGSQIVLTRQEGQKKLVDQDEEWIKRFRQRADEGYQILQKEITQYVQKGIVSIHDEIEPTSISEYEMNSEGIALSRDPEKLQEYFDEGGTLQKLYGFSVNVMLTLYEISTRLLSDKRNNEAINSLTFLCNLNPNISSFWIALGLSYEAEQKWDEAMEAHQIAIAIDPLDFNIYYSLIRCCGLIKDYSVAKEILESARKNESIRGQVEDAFAYIKKEESG